MFHKQVVQEFNQRWMINKNGSYKAVSVIEFSSARRATRTLSVIKFKKDKAFKSKLIVQAFN